MSSLSLRSAFERWPGRERLERAEAAHRQAVAHKMRRPPSGLRRRFRLTPSLCRLLQPDEATTHLAVRWHYLDARGARVVALALDGFPRLTTVTLHANGMSERALAAFCRGLAFNETVTMLNIIQPGTDLSQAATNLDLLDAVEECFRTNVTLRRLTVHPRHEVFASPLSFAAHMAHGVTRNSSLSSDERAERISANRLQRKVSFLAATRDFQRNYIFERQLLTLIFGFAAFN